MCIRPLKMSEIQHDQAITDKNQLGHLLLQLYKYKYH